MKFFRTFAFLLIITLLPVFSGGHGLVRAAQDTAASRKELQRIKREMQENKKKIKQADQRERSVLTDLETIDREIQTGDAELAEQQKWLRDAESALRDIEKSNADITHDLAGLKQAYRQRLRALYKMGRNGYAAAIFASENLQGALKRVKYLGMVAEQDRKIMHTYQASLAKLTRQQTEITGKKDVVSQRGKLVEANRIALETQKRKKAGILTSVRAKKSLHEQMLTELQEASVGLGTMIRKMEQENKAARPDPPRNRSAGTDRKRFPWPMNGQVLTRFGVQRHPQFGTPVFRRGIEIEARVGDAVHAMEVGQVAYADWYKGYGMLVILEHVNGLYSLYGHLSRIEVKNGDHVATGQVVGLAGDTGSLKGPKLYFEIRRHGEAEDPLLWLALK